MISVHKTPILARMLSQLSEHVENIVVVAGYREELIHEYCQGHFRDVVVARNPDYATTNTAHSLALGAKLITGKTLFLDGDLLMEGQSLKRFMAQASETEVILGVADAKTEQPVFADCVETGSDLLTLTSFSRDTPSKYEWANLFVGQHDIMNGAQHYVFEKLAQQLPLPAVLIDVEEIDTPDDMARAEAAVQRWGN